MKNILKKKILNENMSNSENLLFKKWIGESEDNREIFRKLRTKEMSSIILELESQCYGEKMSKEFTAKIAIIRNKRRKRLFFGLSTVTSAAIIILFFSVFQKNTIKENELTTNIEYESEPEKEYLEISNNAIQLITPKGVIDLDEEGVNTINKIYVDSVRMQIEQNNSINTVVVPIKREYNFTLPDGTKVWLNSGSKLSFPTQFSDTLRDVKLVGEAYFEVVKNSKAPFIVSTKRLQTKVLGTGFMVSSDAEKYEVSLVEGKVDVQDVISGEKILLKPGKGAVLNSLKETFDEVDINIEKVLNRKNGLFMFDEEELIEITAQLKKWYGVDFIFENEDLKKHRFYIKINKYNDIKDVMELLKSTNMIDYEINDNIIIIK